MPYLDVTIGDKIIPAEIDLGFEGMFSLPSHLIKDIAEKKWVDCTRSYGVRGKVHENDVYKVKNIGIQGILNSRENYT